ncbi:ABC transporter ATP-binding protein [Nesterenkonia lacusekhoensis]|uniref:Iron(III) transport system ATP-binding protein n=1 Tax=Nesterenkonia lacusekhoensis TaxID=150832 RepID=A0ABS4T344_9MICC|nr:iron(III) transport system ATP-binding protein [Nesterenkonia lacusekhoensis]
MSSVRFDAVDVVFDDGHRALDSVSLEIADGEIIALVGPSGSGKTTLLRSLAGFLRPSGGTISIDGQVLSSPRHSTAVEQRGLGMVFQQHALWPHMKAAENIGYPLRLAGVRRAERRARVEESLEMVGLAGMGGRRPDQLSGGQRQRVALARAIIHQPRVLLLDEALSALDEPLRASLRAQLQSMSKRLGLTVVHVTHDRAEALAVADRIVVLDHGRVQQIGGPEEVMERPASGFVAQFLQDAALLGGELHSEGFRCEQLGLEVPRQRISRPQRDSETEAAGACVGELAVAPHHVLLSPAEGDEARGAEADVVSSLYGRHVHEVEVSWAGRRLRGETVGWRPAPGDRVRAEVIGGVFYPAGSGEEVSGGDLDEQSQRDHDQAPEDPQGDGEPVEVPLGDARGSQ